MAELDTFLFGKFSAQQDGRVVALATGKVQELFCYLLLHRTRPGPRERLASLLWPYTTTAQSKAYLRRALWQLQSTFKSQLASVTCPVLVVSAEWIQCNPDLDLWLDVDVFELAYRCAEGTPGRMLSDQQATRLHRAVDLYEGDLLENYHQEWCLYQRERFHHQFVVMLDKLAAFHESHRQYEVALSYAERNLATDRARERTQRQLMRLRCLLDDRTGAMRQYESCREALQEDLDTEPSDATKQLYAHIRDGSFKKDGPVLPSVSAPRPRSPQSTINQLNAALDLLDEAQERVRREVEALKELLSRDDGDAR